jgi:hypothetical protein
MPLSQWMLARTRCPELTETVTSGQRGRNWPITATSRYRPGLSRKEYRPSARVRVLAVTLAAGPADRDRASIRTPATGRGRQGWPGRSTGQPGLASTTPETSAPEPEV